jgi:hypothetical protein
MFAFYGIGWNEVAMLMTIIVLLMVVAVTIISVVMKAKDKR